MRQDLGPVVGRPSSAARRNRPRGPARAAASCRGRSRPARRWRRRRAGRRSTPAPVLPGRRPGRPARAPGRRGAGRPPAAPRPRLRDARAQRRDGGVGIDLGRGQHQRRLDGQPSDGRRPARRARAKGRTAKPARRRLNTTSGAASASAKPIRTTGRLPCRVLPGIRRAACAASPPRRRSRSSGDHAPGQDVADVLEASCRRAPSCAARRSPAAHPRHRSNRARCIAMAAEPARARCGHRRRRGSPHGRTGRPQAAAMVSRARSSSRASPGPSSRRQSTWSWPWLPISKPISCSVRRSAAESEPAAAEPPGQHEDARASARAGRGWARRSPDPRRCRRRR